MLTGDSAGGHLVLSVTLMAILRGFKVPSFLMAHYPATYVDISTFFPSSLMSLDDPLVTSSFLKYCFLSFNKDGRASQRNPLLGPLYASDYLLKKFPPVRIFVCEVDPLRDGALAFGLRLKKNGVDV